MVPRPEESDGPEACGTCRRSSMQEVLAESLLDLPAESVAGRPGGVAALARPSQARRRTSCTRRVAPPCVDVVMLRCCCCVVLKSVLGFLYQSQASPKMRKIRTSAPKTNGENQRPKTEDVTITLTPEASPDKRQA